MRPTILGASDRSRGRSHEVLWAPDLEVKAAKAEQMRGESLRLDLARLIGIARNVDFD
jgi:hypothetical protein